MTETHAQPELKPLPAKRPKISPDLILLSSDSQRIPARRRILEAHSEVLADLIEVAVTAGTDEVELLESCGVLEVVLSYCSSARLVALDPGRDDVWDISAAFHKYQVSNAHSPTDEDAAHDGLVQIGRGLDAVASAWQQKCQTPQTTPFKDLLSYYLFAVGYSAEDVSLALSKIIAAGVDSNVPFASSLLSDLTSTSGLSDGGKLVTLLTTRARYLQMARATALAAEFANNLKSKGDALAIISSFGVMLELWTDSRSCTTERALAEYLKGKDAAVAVGKGLIPWRSLRDVLKQLPTELE